MKHLSALAAVVAVLIPAVPHAAPAAPAVAPEFAGMQTAADLVVARRGFRGVALVLDQGREVWRYQSGTRDCAGKDPLDPGDRFDMGSIVKVFTATTILKLVEQGRLSLDDRLGDRLPGVPADKASITIRQLITHSSGLVDSLGEDETYISKSDLLAQAFATPLLFAPGEGEEYSNVGYSVLAAIIEKVTGKPYERALRDLVLRPAGVTSIGYTNRWPKSRQVCGILDGAAWGAVTDYFDRRGPSWHLVGNGGLQTTPSDLANWLEALWAGKLLNPADTAFMKDKLSRQDRSVPKRRTYGTNGSNRIFSSYYEYWPDQRMAFLLMTDDSHAPKEYVVAYFDPALDAIMDARDARR